MNAHGAEYDAFFPLAQTLEWKGWMMVFFLLYHYWDVKPAYNAVRVAVGAYLFLTGYGNYLSLSKKGPSLTKLAASVLRINFFTFLVMATTGRGWVLYYIAPLHTLWTAVVYGLFSMPTAWPMRYRLAGVLAVIVFIYEVPYVADTIFLPLYPLLSYCGSLKEWVFRSRLDAYAPWAGMAFAAAVPKLVDFLDARGVWGSGGGVGGGGDSMVSSSESSSDSGSGGSVNNSVLPQLSSPLPSAPLTLFRAVGWSGLVDVNGRIQWRPLSIGSCVILLALVHSTQYAKHRFDYNSTHRLLEWVPITTFLLLRNLTPALRRVHLRLFAWLGEMSLELYILQFHVWMAGDAKKIVVLFPAFRTLSFFTATLGFVVLAACASAATGTLIKAIDAHGHNAVLASAAVLLLGISIINFMPGSCAVGGGGG